MATAEFHVSLREDDIFNIRFHEDSGLPSSVTQLDVHENGDYDAGEDAAYNPVHVDVPNSYSAEDEGRVVSNGNLVEQTPHAIVTENGFIDTTLNNSVTVDIHGHGYASGSYTQAENARSIKFNPGLDFTPSVFRIALKVPQYGVRADIAALYAKFSGININGPTAGTHIDYVYYTLETREDRDYAGGETGHTIPTTLIIDANEVQINSRTNGYLFIAGEYKWEAWE